MLTAIICMLLAVAAFMAGHWRGRHRRTHCYCRGNLAGHACVYDCWKFRGGTRGR